MLAHDDPSAHGREREVREQPVAEPHASVLRQPTEPRGNCRRVIRNGGDDAREQSGLDGDARCLVEQTDVGLRLGSRLLGLGHEAVDREYVDHLPCADERAVILSTASAAVRNGMTRKAA